MPQRKAEHGASIWHRRAGLDIGGTSPNQGESRQVRPGPGRLGQGTKTEALE